MYADDATLYNSDKDIEQLKYRMNMSEERAETWYSANNLKLNRGKTQKIIFSTNNSVREGLDVELLGVTLDNRLSWSGHVERLCGRVSSHIFLLRQMGKVTNTDTQLMLYFALIHSQLSYGVILWGGSSWALQVFRLQKTAVRIIANAGYREHCKPHFLNFEIMTLPCLYVYHSLLVIHKNKATYGTHSEIHNYNTRHAGDLIIPKFRYNKSKRNTVNLHLYNKIPIVWRDMKYNLFKSKVKKYLIDNAFYSVSEFMETPIEAA